MTNISPWTISVVSATNIKYVWSSCSFVKNKLLMLISDKNCHHKCAPFIILVFKIASVKYVPIEVRPSGAVYRRLLKKNTRQSGKAPHQDSYFTGKYNNYNKYMINIIRWVLSHLKKKLFLHIHKTWSRRWPSWLFFLILFSWPDESLTAQ